MENQQEAYNAELPAVVAGIAALWRKELHHPNRFTGSGSAYPGQGKTWRQKFSGSPIRSINKSTLSPYSGPLTTDGLRTIKEKWGGSSQTRAYLGQGKARQTKEHMQEERAQSGYTLKSRIMFKYSAL